MATLRADNRNLFKDTKYSFLLSNSSSQSSSITIANTEGFFANSFICLGQIGSENTEIVQIEDINSVTGVLNLIYFNGKIVNMVANGLNTTVTTDKPHGLAVGASVTISNTVSVNGTYTCLADAAHGTNTFVISHVFTSFEPGLWVSSSRTTTNFAHAESTRVTVVPYNTVRFFHTQTPSTPNATTTLVNTVRQNVNITDKKQTTYSATPSTTTYTKTTDPSYVQTVDLTPPITFNSATPLTNFIYINPAEFFTNYVDDSRYTGFGWFAFFNTTTLKYSAISNPIPYAGFDDNTVKAIFDSVDSCLNTKEIKLITNNDRYSWLNEAYAYITNELNLGNWEYNASREIVLNLSAGISEYLLPEDFASLLYINDSKTLKIEEENATFQRPLTNSVMKYMLQGKYLVFTPTPDADSTVSLSYLKSSPKLKQLSDIVDLPNRGHYYIKDFMLYRAYKKLTNPSEAQWYYTIFNKNIENLKIYSCKRDDSLDSWSVATTSNI